MAAVIAHGDVIVHKRSLEGLTVVGVLGNVKGVVLPLLVVFVDLGPVAPAIGVGW